MNRPIPHSGHSGHHSGPRFSPRLLRHGVPPLAAIALVAAGVASVMSASPPAEAASAASLDRAVDATLKQFVAGHRGAQQLLDQAQGVLVFPELLEGAVVVGGEYGEGALRVNGKSVAYYNKVSMSAGVQIGGQSKTLIVFFFDSAALDGFRKSRGWQVGVDGQVVVLGFGANGELTSTNIKDPVAAVVMNAKGLMAGVSLEGSKFTRIDKE